MRFCTHARTIKIRATSHKLQGRYENGVGCEEGILFIEKMKTAIIRTTNTTKNIAVAHH